MDHLSTSEERKNRWYAKNIKPIFLPIKDIDIHGVDIHSPQKSASSQRNNNDKSDSDSENYVNGIPFDLMYQPKMKEYMKSHLKNHGFVIITKALSLKECNHGLKLAWDYIEAASSVEQCLEKYLDENKKKKNDTGTGTGTRVTRSTQTHQESQKDKDDICLQTTIARNDPSTYSKYLPRTVEGGILPFYGSGHTSFMWYLRSHPSIQEVFATIHNTTREELVSSLDGIIAWICTNPTNDCGWFHIDQNPMSKPEFESVQGLVNLLPVGMDTGGNVLVEKSHLFFPHHYLEDRSSNQDNHQDNKNDDNDDNDGILPRLFYKERLREINGDDWLEIDPYDKELLDPANVISCMLGPGDIIIWDSRLVHCSYPATTREEREVANSDSDGEVMKLLNNKHGFIRTAGLVNMIPRSKVSDQTRCQRIEAINRCRTLTHWVDKVAPLGEERSEEAQKEQRCIEFMKQWKGSRKDRSKVLLCYEDLSKDQRNLV
jgi:hypothetical protein